MGITIHWKGKTKDRDTAIKVVNFATEFANALKWDVIPFNEKGYAGTWKIYDEGKEKIIAQGISWESKRDFIGNDAQESIKFGVVINPPDPINTESVEISFFEYNDELIIQGFCKTQVFNDNEIYNLYAHIIICTLLKTIKNTWLNNLEINDEGDFCIPADRSERIRWADKHLVEPFNKQYYDAKPFDFKLLVKAHRGNLDVINNLNKLLTGKDIGGLFLNYHDEEK